LRLAWIAGLLLFIFLIYKIGPERILSHIRALSFSNFLLLFFLRFFYWLLRTLGWKFVSDSYGDKISFFRLFAARLSGYSISYLTPSAHIGGEAIRTMCLNTPNRRKGLASVIVDKTIEIITAVLLAIVGFLFAVIKIPMPRELKITFLVIALATTMFMIFIMLKQKQGLFEWFFRTLGRMKIRPRFYDNYRERLNETDNHIADFYSEHKGPFMAAFVIHAVCIFFWALEIWMTLHFLGVTELSFLGSYLIVSLGTFAFIVPAIPASLGTYDITFLALFALFGIPTESGMTAILIRRIIALGWVGAGLAFMSIARGKSRQDKIEMAA
jgi:uncharacterized protein (TIRG00374 family)